MKAELNELGYGHYENPQGESPLEKAERMKDYPEVARLGRVIDSDTRMVVVGNLVKNLEEGYRPSFKELQTNSVQLWSQKINLLGLDTASEFPGIYLWRGPYDSEFLGIMAGMLQTPELINTGVAFA